VDAYRKLGTSWLHLVFALIIAGLLSLFVGFIWTLIPIAGWFTGPGLFIFLGSVVAELLPAIVVVEKSKWFEPISRAWNLARRRFWWLLGFSIIFFLFNLLIVSAPTLLIQSLTNTLLGGSVRGNGYLISTLISSVVGGLLHLFTLPILTTAWTLIYFDLRIRTEGFDLAFATLESSENVQTEIFNLPIPVSQQKWLSWEDISKFAVISLSLFGIIALAFGVFAIIVVVARSMVGQ
jgi:hypothetical protein